MADTPRGSAAPATLTTGPTTIAVMRQRTWPIVECDQNTSPNLYDVVTQEVADAMPPGTEVIIAFIDRLNRPRVALAWGYAALAVVTEHKPTADGGDVVVCVRALPRCEHRRWTMRPGGLESCADCGTPMGVAALGRGPTASNEMVYDELAPLCTYYQGCGEYAKSCGYCPTHCLCGVPR